MARTLGELRQDVFYLLDDSGSASSDGDRWSLSEVDFALEVSLDECIRMYASAGGNRLDQQVEVSTTSGVLDLSSYKPVSIKSIDMKHGSVYYPVTTARVSDAFHPVESTDELTCRVTFVPGVVNFPSASGDTVVYGAGEAATFPAFDRMIAVKAAQMLKVKEAEPNSLLDIEEQRLWSSVLSAGQIPSVRDMMDHSPVSSYMWVQKPPHSIQLLHRQYFVY